MAGPPSTTPPLSPQHCTMSYYHQPLMLMGNAGHTIHSIGTAGTMDNGHGRQVKATPTPSATRWLMTASDFLVCPHHQGIAHLAWATGCWMLSLVVPKVAASFSLVITLLVRSSFISLVMQAEEPEDDHQNHWHCVGAGLWLVRVCVWAYVVFGLKLRGGGGNHFRSS